MNIALSIDWTAVQLDTPVLYIWLDTKFILVTFGIIAALRVRKLIRDKKRRLAKASYFDIAPVPAPNEFDDAF